MSYTLYISSLSPYSFKAAALLGYAGIPCQVKHENIANRYAVLQRLTGQTMVPVLRRGAWAINDSTHIAEWAEHQSERTLVPEQPALASVCWLLEEFADEWITRWMVFSRWCHEQDAERTSRAIGEEMVCGVPVVHRPVGSLAGRLIQNQLARGGAREANRRALEQSRDRTLQALENLLEETDGYLFGEEPTVADFAVYGQLEQYRRDPSGGERMEMHPAIGEWLDAVDQMRIPHPVVAIRHGVDAAIEELQPLFAEFFGTYWRVVVAVHRARSVPGEAREEVCVELLDGTRFEARASKYVASRLEFILRHLDRLSGDEVLAGPEGLGVQAAIDRAAVRLGSYEAGARMLEEFEGLSG